MRLFFLLSLSILATSGVARATSTAYDIPPGKSETFVVTGSSPTLHQTQGEASITGTAFVAGAWLVTVACSANSSGNCQGTIES